MLKLEYKDYTLDFKFVAGTSRGKLTEHPVIFLRVYDAENPLVYGLGEAAPLFNLSPETVDDVRDEIEKLALKFKELAVPASEDEVFRMVDLLVPETLPSLRMGLEVALLDLINGGTRLIFDNSFYRAEKDIPINGLIWMGEKEHMKNQIKEKLSTGYKCIKMKVGAIDFEKELELLEMLRGSSDKLMIRLDANGAFATDQVFKKLAMLEPLGIHSIEQPIMPGQPEAMQLLCSRSPIPIALDEELIGTTDPSQKHEMLKMIRPQYIILKPTLLGGFKATAEWIRLAERLDIGWWLTSALESNIGLNAIAQFAGNFPDSGYQGLGTGQLYHNNITSPLEINGAYLGNNLKKQWQDIF